MTDEIQAGTKKKPRRKPMTLLVPVGQRTVERDDGLTETETLYTMEVFTSVTDLRSNLEAREMDQTNAKGIVLFRADPIPVEQKMKSQVVIKFGKHAEEDGV